jgi:hypothetical protein
MQGLDSHAKPTADIPLGNSPLANRKGLFNSKTKGLKIVRREIKWSGE